MTQGHLFPLPKFDSEDPCARKHGGSPTSQAAFAKVDVTGDSLEALRCYREAGDKGLNGKRLALAMKKTFNAVSGRIKPLVDSGYIRPTGQIEEGSRVMVITAMGREAAGARGVHDAS